MRSLILGPGLALLAAACGKPSPVVSPGHDDGGQASLACEAQRGHVTSIYEAAAEAETVPANLHEDFVSSLVHLAISDCMQSPRRVATCLSKSSSARDIETQCLLPIDDEGKTEGRRFANSEAAK